MTASVALQSVRIRMGCLLRLEALVTRAATFKGNATGKKRIEVAMKKPYRARMNWYQSTHARPRCGDAATLEMNTSRRVEIARRRSRAGSRARACFSAR